MGKMIIADVPGANGEYEADLSYFTNRELHEVKLQTGLVAGQLTEALAARTFDNDVIMAFALTVFNRLNKNSLMDLVWEARAGTVTFDFDEEEVTGDPPAETPTGTAAAENGNGDSPDSSGGSSRTLLVLPASAPSPTGFPASDTGGTSDPAISAS